MFFSCPRFAEEEEERLESSLTPEADVEVMLESEENWTAVSSFVTAVMKRLREKEQESRKTRESEITIPR